MDNYEDKEINCVDCKNQFILTAGEQEFFNKKGFQEPKRCKDCRKKKTAEMRARQATQ